MPQMIIPTSFKIRIPVDIELEVALTRRNIQRGLSNLVEKHVTRHLEQNVAFQTHSLGKDE